MLDELSIWGLHHLVALAAIVAEWEMLCIQWESIGNVGALLPFIACSFELESLPIIVRYIL